MYGKEGRHFYKIHAHARAHTQTHTQRGSGGLWGPEESPEVGTEFTVTCALPQWEENTR